MNDTRSTSQESVGGSLRSGNGTSMSASTTSFDATKKKRKNDKKNKLTWEEKEKAKEKALRFATKRMEVMGKPEKPPTAIEAAAARALQIKMSVSPFLPASMFPPVLNNPFGDSRPKSKSTALGNPIEVGQSSPSPMLKKNQEFGDFILPSVIQDAETKQSIGITKARWSCQEGRVNLDLDSILNSGTGRMNIFGAPPKQSNDLDLSMDKARNDLVTDYLKQGPLKILFHRFWDSKSNKVNVPEKYKDFISEDAFDTFALALARERNTKARKSRPDDTDGTHEGYGDRAGSMNSASGSNYYALASSTSSQPITPGVSGRLSPLFTGRTDTNLNPLPPQSGGGTGQFYDPNRDTAHHPDKHNIDNPNMVELMVGLGIGLAASHIGGPNRDLTLMQHHLPVHHRQHNYVSDHDYNPNQNANFDTQQHQITNRLRLFERKDIDHDRPHHTAEEALTEEEQKELKIPDSINLENEDNWDSMEQKLFDELYGMAYAYEKNKTFTHEKPIKYSDVKFAKTSDKKKGKITLKLICKELVSMKIKAMKEIIRAVDDEDTREKLRLEDVLNCPSDKLKDLHEQHEKQRHASRIYLRSLQHDNEVVFVRKMNEFGWLW